MPEPQQPFGGPEAPPPSMTAAESLVLAELERADVMSAHGVSKADLARRIVAALGIAKFGAIGW